MPPLRRMIDCLPSASARQITAHSLNAIREAASIAVRNILLAPLRARPAAMHRAFSMSQECHQYLKSDQYDHHDFEQLGPIGCRLIGKHTIHSLDHFERPLNAPLPFVEMEARRQDAIDAGQIL